MPKTLRTLPLGGPIDTTRIARRTCLGPGCRGQKTFMSRGPENRICFKCELKQLSMTNRAATVIVDAKSDQVFRRTLEEGERL